MKNGQKVFVIYTQRISVAIPKREVVREGILKAYHPNISEVDFGEVVGVQHTYTEDIFATKREALEEVLIRYEEGKERIEKLLDELDD